MEGQLLAVTKYSQLGIALSITGIANQIMSQTDLNVSL